MQPSLVINALGYSTFSKYDLRNRKVAEYGTGAQPATFGYDDADNLTKLTTYRATGKVISTDPSGLEGDTTTWKYDLATGLELRKTYADGKGTVKTYDAYNNLATVTDARGVVASYSYNLSRGLLTGIDLSDGTPAQKFTYNFLGQVVSVQDASGARSISYGRYGSQLEEVQQIASSRFLLQEQRDAYGRGTGYILKRNGNRQCAASITYGTLGRIALAGFIHAGVEHQFRYGYLAGSNLLQSLTMPNGVTLTQSYEQKRNLLTEMLYAGTSGVLAKRSYTYDVLGRPTARGTEYPQRERKRQDVFGYNQRSELTCARLGETGYRYAYDNIGNRISTQEAAEEMTYVANDLNQYTQIDTNGNDFTPEYDEDGNQTLIQTSTGIWRVTYNAQNRAIRFENESNGTVITCDYDYMGRRIWKKVENANGTVTLHQHYIYYDYLQIAALDLTRATLNGLWLLTWDPSQAVATRPLAIQINGTWYTYGWDLTKNICELYTSSGAVGTSYTYTPYGTVSIASNAAKVTQSIQWSSEYHDAETGLVYYNYRYYNPRDGRWTRRDFIGIEGGVNLYVFCVNIPSKFVDVFGQNIWVENGLSALTFHQRVCVTIWNLNSGDDPCCGATKTGKKYCISFAPAPGRGSSSASDSSSRSSYSASSSSDSSAIPQGPHSSSTYTAAYSDINFKEGTLPPGMDANGTPEYKNGEVYKDEGCPIWWNTGEVETTCKQDQQIQAYLASLVGLQAHYSLGGQNCRAFSQSVRNEVERVLRRNTSSTQ